MEKNTRKKLQQERQRKDRSFTMDRHAIDVQIRPTQYTYNMENQDDKIVNMD